MEGKIFSNLHEIEHLITPDIAVGEWSYIDTDDELQLMAEFIKKYSMHHESIDVNRIKFIYTKKHKKISGRFIIGDIILRSEMEKIVNDDYDYIICVDYAAWKELDSKNKVMQLDKLLCGIDAGDSLKKKAADSREYIDNLQFFGADNALNSSYIVDLCISRIVDKEKDDKKQSKEKAQVDEI